VTDMPTTEPRVSAPVASAAAAQIAGAARLGRRRRRLAIALLIGPALLVVLGALIVPVVNLLIQSFIESTGYAQVAYHFTFSNYVSALTNPTYRSVAYNAFGLGALAAVICTALSYPVAYFITFRLTKGKNIALFLVVASLFSSYLVRLYAWYTILGQHGIINAALARLGIVHHPLLFLIFNRWAVLIAFVNIFLPYTILMLTSAMQNLPRDLLDTAHDLGANQFMTFRRVLLPLTTTGAVAALAYTFILASGDYITPALLGGINGEFIGDVVSDQFVSLGNVPEGAAISFVMLAVFMIVYAALSRLERFRGI
jgi:spermidine/putrescine transport system permease protein